MTEALVPQVLDPVRAPGEGARPASGISGSKGNRAIQCLASTVLPRVEDSEPGEPAIKGKVIHAYLADVAKQGQEKALDEAPEEYREICAAIDLSRIPSTDSGKFSHEVAMAYDAHADTARIVGYDIGRNYGELAPGEIPLTIDVLGLTEDGQGVVVLDYKSGRLPVPPPAKNWQLKICAVAAARRFSARYAVIGIVHTPEGSKPWMEHGRLDAFDLDEAAEQLRELVERRAQLAKSFLVRGYAGLGNSVVRGPECRYCPSFAFCPAMTSHVRAALGDPLAFQREVLSLISAEQLGLAKEAVAQIKGLVEQLEEQVKACATEHPAIMPSGRFYGPVQQPDDELDADVVRQVLKDWLLEIGEDPQKLVKIAVESTTSQAAIERALKEIAPKGSLAGMKREAIRRIRAAGGVKSAWKTVIREYTGQPKRLPATGET
jgi:hypothetical protein